jgi:hypothetical protein
LAKNPKEKWGKRDFGVELIKEIVPFFNPSPIAADIFLQRNTDPHKTSKM